MTNNKNRLRKAELERLCLKHEIEILVSKHGLKKSKNTISFSQSKLKTQRLSTILNELGLIKKEKNALNKYRLTYQISTELEDLLYKHFSNSEDFKQYTK